MKIFEDLPEGIQAELHTSETETSRVSFSNSELELVSDSVHKDMTLRALGEGKISSAQSSQPGSEDKMLQRAFSAIQYGSRADYDFPADVDVPEMELVDDKVRSISIDKMLEIADDLNSTLVEYNSRLKVRAIVGRNFTRTHLANSNGFEGEYEKTSWQVALGGRLIDGDDMLSIYERSVASEFSDDYEDLKQEVMDRFDKASTIVPAESGTYPVIFAPSQVNFLIRPLAACLSGTMVAKGVSPWKDKLGEKLLDYRVTLIDDGTLPMQPSSVPFDREGILTERNVLIDEGVPSSLLLDLQSAHLLDMEPTGNGSAGGRGPSPHHLILPSGEKSLQEVIREIDEGVIIYGSMGAWAGNPFSGSVSGTISLGFKIEKGEIAGRIKDSMFSLNAFETLSDRIIEFTSNTETQGKYTFPYVALDDVVISTNG